MSKRSATHATFVIERQYDHSPAHVFRAFEDTDAKRKWFVEGEGWEIEDYQTDFKVGGYERRGTRLVFTEQGAFLDGHDNVAQREEGARGLLEALDTYLRAHS